MTVWESRSLPAFFVFAQSQRIDLTCPPAALRLSLHIGEGIGEGRGPNEYHGAPYVKGGIYDPVAFQKILWRAVCNRRAPGVSQIAGPPKSVCIDM